MKGSCREKKEINWQVNQKMDDAEDQDLGPVTGRSTSGLARGWFLVFDCFLTPVSFYTLLLAGLTMSNAFSLLFFLLDNQLTLLLSS